MKNVYAMYFSPTGTTKKVSEAVAKEIADKISADFKVIDFTLPKSRETVYSFKEEDIVVFATPVYAGRVPNLLLKFIETVKGNHTLAVPIALFGNRSFDDALMELKIILNGNGFQIVGAAGFVGEHSFSKVLAAGRPDNDDMKLAEDFAKKVADKIKKGKFADFEIKGNIPTKYYQPLDGNGNPIDIRKVKPKTRESCTSCGICADACPMGSIDRDKGFEVVGICIKCGACIKKCPVGAKYYDDEGYLFHKSDLEKTLEDRAKVEIFL